MIKSFFYIALLILFNFSCSPFKQSQKKLPGTWKVTEVRIEDGEGFLFYDSSAQGSFDIDGAYMNGKTVYSYSYFGQYEVTDSVVLNAFKYTLTANGEQLFIERATDTLQAKIIMLTKDKLTFEFYDFLQYRLKRFSCTRQ